MADFPFAKQPNANIEFVKPLAAAGVAQVGLLMANAGSLGPLGSLGSGVPGRKNGIPTFVDLKSFGLP